MILPKQLTVEDILKGCQCAVAEICGEAVVIRCVTCPIHGDEADMPEEER